MTHFLSAALPRSLTSYQMLQLNSNHLQGWSSHSKQFHPGGGHCFFLTILGTFGFIALSEDLKINIIILEAGF